MTERRSSRLLAKKILAETSVPSMQNAPIFDPELGDVLVRILDQLDPSSFVKFARTCRYTYNFCQNARGIEVLFGGKRNGVALNDFYCEILVSKPIGLDVNIEMFKIGGLQKGRRLPHFKRPFSNNEIEALQNMPFIIEIEDVKFNHFQAGSRVMKKLAQFLRRFRSVVIRKITPTYIREWSALAEFIQEFYVNCFYGMKEVRGNSTIPTDLLPVFLNRVSFFFYVDYVSDDLILAAKSKCLCLPEASISIETFHELVKKLEASDFFCWCTGRRQDLRNDVESDPFIKFCRETRENIQVDDLNVSEMKKGVFYTRPANPREFLLVKNDGSIGSVTVGERFIDLNPFHVLSFTKILSLLP